MLDKSLINLRNKDLVFGCYVEIKGYDLPIIGFTVSSTNKKDAGKYRLFDNTHKSAEEIKKMGVNGSPLHFGRIAFLCTELEKQFNSGQKTIGKKGLRIPKRKIEVEFGKGLEDVDDDKRMIANSHILNILAFFRERPEMCDQNELARERHKDWPLLKELLMILSDYFKS